MFEKKKSQPKIHTGKNVCIPLSFQELHNDIENRLGRITEEFSRGFNFLSNCEKTVTFFGSARTMPGEPYYEKARRLAKRIVTELDDYGVITGGGPGIMGAGNCGAMDAGGKSIGFTIKLPMEQVTNPCVTHEIKFKYFFSRKVCMTYASEAYVYFPGGYGTLDELFEILTLVQTQKIPRVPVILVGKKYWNDLEKFMRKHLLKGQKIDAADLDLYTITEDEDEILNIIKNAPVRRLP